MVFKESDPPPFYALQLAKSKYVGQPKGIYQVLYERGMYVANMRGGLTKKEQERRLLEGKPLVEPELDAPLVLSQCEDFANEIGALDHQLRLRGHRLILSPKCHPELAGIGIEYSWGKVKMIFRSEFNNGKASELMENVEASITPDVLPLERVWRYSRRTRDYMRAYQLMAEHPDLSPEDQSFRLIEAVCKKYKTHRNMGEIARDFINEA